MEHDLETVMNISDRVVVMAEGRVIADGLPIFSAYELPHEIINEKIYGEINTLANNGGVRRIIAPVDGTVTRIFKKSKNPFHKSRILTSEILVRNIAFCIDKHLDFQVSFFNLDCGGLCQRWGIGY